MKKCIDKFLRIIVGLFLFPVLIVQFIFERSYEVDYKVSKVLESFIDNTIDKANDVIMKITGVSND